MIPSMGLRFRGDIFLDMRCCCCFYLEYIVDDGYLQSLAER
jgi:hypothetical protein